MTDYTEVTEKDFDELNKLYLDFVKETHYHIQEHPELKELIDDFIKQSGEATKAVLLRYRQSEYVAKLSEEDWKDKYQSINHKNVKMKLAMGGVEKAVNKFVNEGKSD